MSSKVIKTIEEGAIITSLVAGIGFVGRKVAKEDVTDDPSRSLMNYLKMIGAVSAAIAIKDWMQEKKYIPNV